MVATEVFELVGELALGPADDRQEHDRLPEAAFDVVDHALSIPCAHVLRASARETRSYFRSITFVGVTRTTTRTVPSGSVA
ncbi:hypothetical protein GCM10028815_19560 [Mariniluteicoccus flavus]